MNNFVFKWKIILYFKNLKLSSQNSPPNEKFNFSQFAIYDSFIIERGSNVIYIILFTKKFNSIIEHFVLRSTLHLMNGLESFFKLQLNIFFYNLNITSALWNWLTKWKLYVYLDTGAFSAAKKNILKGKEEKNRKMHKKTIFLFNGNQTESPFKLLWNSF